MGYYSLYPPLYLKWAIRGAKIILTKTTRSFDCVEMVEKAQEEIRDKLAALSREEQLAFWQAQTEKLRERQQNAQREQKESVSQQNSHSPV